MNTFRLFARLILLVCLPLNLLVMRSGPAQAAGLAENKSGAQSSLREFMNPDGTLRLDGKLNGTIDLQGWNVQIDSQRGPIFVPANSNLSNLPAASLASPSNWAGLGHDGSGGGSISQTINWALAVHAIAVHENIVYVGGAFTDLNNNGAVLTSADYIARWDGTTWSALGSNGMGNGALNDPVYAIYTVGNDVYVGGRFTNVNNNGTVLNAADYIAKWDGTNWSALGNNGAGDGSLGAGSVVFAVAGNGSNNIFVGGSFFNVNNNGTVLNSADNVAKWDGTNWSPLGSNGSGDGSILQDFVYALAVDGSNNVYAGGLFRDVNNNGIILTAADHLAKWDGTSWSALGSNGAGDGSICFGCNVRALAVIGTDLYVGGNFGDVNNHGTVLTAADYFAKWDGANWSSVGSNGTGNGSLNAVVFAINIAGDNNIYVGGGFSDVNNNGVSLGSADKVAKWDGTNWSALGSNGAGDGSIPGLDPSVFALLVTGTDVYAGGNFTNVNNNGTVLNNADYIAAYGISTSPPPPDLAITISDSPDPATVGGSLTYTLTITNISSSAATGVIVTDTLSKAPKVNFVSVTSSQGTCSGRQTISCDLGTLNSGGSATITIVVKPNKAGSVSNTAIVTSIETDPNQTNNTATAVTVVNPRR